MRRSFSLGLKTPSTIPFETGICTRTETKGGDVALELEDNGSALEETSIACADPVLVSGLVAHARHRRGQFLSLRRAETKQTTHFCSSCNWTSQMRHHPSNIGFIQEASFASHFRQLAPEERDAAAEQEELRRQSMQSDLDPHLRSRGFWKQRRQTCSAFASW